MALNVYGASSQQIFSRKLNIKLTDPSNSRLVIYYHQMAPDLASLTRNDM